MICRLLYWFFSVEVHASSAFGRLSKKEKKKLRKSKENGEGVFPVISSVHFYRFWRWFSQFVFLAVVTVEPAPAQNGQRNDKRKRRLSDGEDDVVEVVEGEKKRKTGEKTLEIVPVVQNSGPFKKMLSPFSLNLSCSNCKNFSIVSVSCDEEA